MTVIDVHTPDLKLIPAQDPSPTDSASTLPALARRLLGEVRQLPLAGTREHLKSIHASELVGQLTEFLAVQAAARQHGLTVTAPTKQLQMYGLVALSYAVGDHADLQKVLGTKPAFPSLVFDETGALETEALLQECFGDRTIALTA